MADKTGPATEEAYAAAARAEATVHGYHETLTPEQFAGHVAEIARRPDHRAAVDIVWAMARADLRWELAEEIRAAEPPRIQLRNGSLVTSYSTREWAARIVTGDAS